MAEFWEMTPVETQMAIEAYLWREERRQKRDMALAWRVAALMRAKRLPSLKALLAMGPAKPLQGKELKKRREEFREASARIKGMDLAELVRKRRQ